jgi:hypothetical protein
MANKKPILCLDFDGVVHSYTSGWKGAATIPDPPVEGFFEWAIEARKYFTLIIHSSRFSGEDGHDGAQAAKEWCHEHMRKWFDAHPEKHEAILTDGAGPLGFGFSATKPPAFLTIDDRGWHFDGTWPDPAELLRFKTWQQMTEEDHATSRGWAKNANGDVVLTMSLDDWDKLLLSMGHALSTRIPYSPDFKQELALMNRLCAGNPNWTPYDVEKEFPR